MADTDTSSTATLVAEPQHNDQTGRAKQKPKQLPPFNVVLLDDDDHTYDYVIEMLGKVFGYSSEKGYQMAQEVDASGRVILLTTHKERAELKRDQILGYGKDFRLAASARSMRALIEPVPQ